MEKVDVIYSIMWEDAPRAEKLGALLDGLAECGLPAQALAGGRIVNVTRPSAQPARSARVIVALLADEIRATGIHRPVDYVVFTPHDEAEILHVGA